MRGQDIGSVGLRQGALLHRRVRPIFLRFMRAQVSMVGESPADPYRIVRWMKRSAFAGLIGGAVIFLDSLIAWLQGRWPTITSIVLVFLGAGMFMASIRVLLPSFPKSL